MCLFHTALIHEQYRQRPADDSFIATIAKLAVNVQRSFEMSLRLLHLSGNQFRPSEQEVSAGSVLLAGDPSQHIPAQLDGRFEWPALEEHLRCSAVCG
jgi:hypothetical protein